MNIGITFGCFIPLHKGHLSMINKSLKENDLTIIGVCGFDDDRGKNFIPFQKRYQLMKMLYERNEKVKIVLIDDKKLGLDGTFTLDNWRWWCTELFVNAGINPYVKTNNITWYSGESNYLSKIRSLYSKHHFELLNRENIEISGTKIRNNPKKYEDMIHPLFRKFLYGKKIL